MAPVQGYVMFPFLERNGFARWPGQALSYGTYFQYQLSKRVALQLDWNKYKQSPFQSSWIFGTVQISSLNLFLFDNGELLGTALCYGLSSPTVTLLCPSISFFSQPNWRIKRDRIEFTTYIFQIFTDVTTFASPQNCSVALGWILW